MLFRSVSQSRYQYYHKESAHVVELGSASGYVCNYLRNRGHVVLGVDRSLSMVRFAKAHYPQNEFRVGDALATQLEREQYDGVMSASLLNVVGLNAGLIQESVRLCKAGGYLSFLFPVEGVTKSQMETYIEKSQLEGFSEATCRFWLQFAKKLVVADVVQMLRFLGLEGCEVHYYLDGMVASVTARKIV